MGLWLDVDDVFEVDFFFAKFLIPFVVKDAVEHGEDKESEEGGGEDAADDNTGEWFLYLGTSAVGKCHGDEA